MSPLEFVSELALRHLGEARAGKLREAYLGTKARLFPLMRLAYGTFNAADLAAHLDKRIGRDFEILMVHSSVNHMRPMFTDGALEMVRMLLDYCGPTRTLAMPAFYFGNPALGGVSGTFRANPRFDLRRTPSQMGLATELFRRMPGAVQSRHPVYRIAALGPFARDLTRGHENAENAAGLGTPFEYMARHDTCIIGIGKSMQVLTQTHHTEAAMGDEFPVPSTVGPALETVVVDGNEEVLVRLIGRTYAGRYNVWNLRKILEAGSLREWRFHHVPLFATRARAVSDQLREAAKRGVTVYDPL